MYIYFKCYVDISYLLVSNYAAMKNKYHMFTIYEYNELKINQDSRLFFKFDIKNKNFQPTILYVHERNDQNTCHKF